MTNHSEEVILILYWMPKAVTTGFGRKWNLGAPHYGRSSDALGTIHKVKTFLLTLKVNKKIVRVLGTKFVPVGFGLLFGAQFFQSSLLYRHSIEKLPSMIGDARTIFLCSFNTC